ncbi:MAG: LysR family transcriptional regulator [Arenicella sp.]
MKIELRHIRYFEAVAAELNFHKASEYLHMSQPALSRAIQQLESRIGAELFERSSRNVQLTPAGKVFLENCSSISKQVDNLEKRVTLASIGEAGNIMIGYTGFSIAGVLPNIIKTYTNKYPGINLMLDSIASNQQIDMLINKKLDFGFLTAPINDSALEYMPVQKDPLVVILHIDHPLAKLEKVELGALVDEPFIMGTEEHEARYNAIMQSICLSEGFLPKVKHIAFNHEAVVGLVSANMGVALYPSCICHFLRSDVTTRPIVNADVDIVTALAWNKDSTNTMHQRFIEFVSDLNNVSI